jgi:hypothetical protein
MDVIVVGQVDLSAEPVHPVPGFKMFIKVVLIADMGVNEENTPKGKGESQDAQEGVGRLSDKVFKCYAYISSYHCFCCSGGGN